MNNLFFQCIVSVLIVHLLEVVTNLIDKIVWQLSLLRELHQIRHLINALELLHVAHGELHNEINENDHEQRRARKVKYHRPEKFKVC